MVLLFFVSREDACNDYLSGRQDMEGGRREVSENRSSGGAWRHVVGWPFKLEVMVPVIPRPTTKIWR
jgi:hypothetical protein